MADDLNDDDRYVLVDVLVADCHGPNLNGDAYTPEALAQLNQQLRRRLATHGPLPAHLNFTPQQVGAVQTCQWQPETGELRAAVKLDLLALHRAAPQLQTPPALALVVQTHYTQCSHCGKVLYSVADSPCPGAHHVIGANALASEFSMGVVEHSAFERPPAPAPTAEVEVKNQPDDWPYAPAHTGDNSDDGT